MIDNKYTETIKTFGGATAELSDLIDLPEGTNYIRITKNDVRCGTLSCGELDNNNEKSLIRYNAGRKSDSVGDIYIVSEKNLPSLENALGKIRQAETTNTYQVKGVGTVFCSGHPGAYARQ